MGADNPASPLGKVISSIPGPVGFGDFAQVLVSVVTNICIFGYLRIYIYSIFANINISRQIFANTNIVEYIRMLRISRVISPQQGVWTAARRNSQLTGVSRLFSTHGK